MGDCRLICGDALTVLPTLPAGSVQCCVTSPPYFGLRDYGAAGQIGLEPTPEAYVSRLVDVFRAVRRVLTDDGTLWLNLGDSYGGNGQTGRNDEDRPTPGGRGGSFNGGIRRAVSRGGQSKQLLGIPWRVAFALQADGWILRSDVIWHKPNPMPESVRDRPTKSHEYLFLFAKQGRYFYDADAVKEPSVQPWSNKNFAQNGRNAEMAASNPALFRTRGIGTRHDLSEQTGRNRRSVWTVATKPLKEAHFAAFPPKLIEPCVLACSRPGDTVLDPFSGAGTTGLVALKHGRRFVGIELNADYNRIAERRLAGEVPLGLPG